MAKTLTNLLYFFSAVVLVKLIGAITSFTVARILSPSDYGVWMTLLLIIAYSSIACLGTVEALLKNYPYYVGISDEVNAKITEDSVFSSLFVSSAILLVCGFSFLHMVDIKEFEPVLSLVRLMLMTAVISSFSAFFYYRYMARQDFKMVSLVETVRAILTFIMLVGFSWLWGISGAVFGFFLCEVVVLTFSALNSKRMYDKVVFNFNVRLMWNLVKVGFPITVVYWVFILQMSTDRVISMAMLGKTATGYYGLGVSIISTLILIPKAVGRVLYPKINQEIGKEAGTKKMFLIVIAPTYTISLLLPLLIGVFVLNAPAVYSYVFPKYLPGLHSAQTLLLGVFFTSLMINGINYLVAHNKQVKTLGIVLGCMAVNAVVNIFLIKMGFYIEGLAAGTAFSGAVLTTLVWQSVLKDMGYDNSRQAKEIFQLYLPFILLVALLAGFSVVDPTLLSMAGAHNVLFTFVFIVLFVLLLLFVPVLNLRSRELYYLFKRNSPVRS